MLSAFLTVVFACVTRSDLISGIGLFDVTVLCGCRLNMKSAATRMTKKSPPKSSGVGFVGGTAGARLSVCCCRFSHVPCLHNPSGAQSRCVAHRVSGAMAVCLLVVSRSVIGGVLGAGVSVKRETCVGAVQRWLNWQNDPSPKFRLQKSSTQQRDWRMFGRSIGSRFSIHVPVPDDDPPENRGLGSLRRVQSAGQSSPSSLLPSSQSSPGSRMPSPHSKHWLSKKFRIVSTLSWLYAQHFCCAAEMKFVCEMLCSASDSRKSAWSN